MTHLRKLALMLAAILGLATATPAMADAGPGRCTGSFVNPITDICWSCLFPISIGGLDIWPSSRPDPDNPDLPVCLCGLRPTTSSSILAREMLGNVWQALDQIRSES